MKKLKITFNSPVVLGFIFLSLAVLIIGFVTLGKSNELLFMTYHSALTNPLTYVRFFTHVLGHSGWEHYIGNAAYILLLGPLLEEKYGSKKLLQVILITAVIFLGQQVYEGVFLQDNISNLSHVLGGIIGSVVGFKLNKKR